MKGWKRRALAEMALRGMAARTARRVGRKEARAYCEREMPITTTTAAEAVSEEEEEEGGVGLGRVAPPMRVP
jgi:hypothetical protein